VESLPYDPNTFDASAGGQFISGLAECGRWIARNTPSYEANGRIALAFTPYSRQSKKGLMETFAIADFNRARIVDGDHGLSLLGSKPDFLKPR